METIRSILADHHRQCDAVFASVERAIQSGNWVLAAAEFQRFEVCMRKHFDAEESILFPAFEERTGMTQGPTSVMRSEHAQIRQLIEAALGAIKMRDADDYSGYAETLHIMTQQHNMKEEAVLYPMCDQHLVTEVPETATRLRAGIEG